VRALVLRTDLPRLALSMVCSRLTGFPALGRRGLLAPREVPLPELPSGRLVRVRTRLGGICGSDLHVLKVEVSRHSSAVAARRDSSGTSIFPGHEAVGQVVAAGPAVQRVRPGQRVVLVPGVFCSAFDDGTSCACCRQGHLALCRRRQSWPPTFLGGGWSEEFVRHETQVIGVPDEIDDETAVLIEPAGCALHGVLRRPPRSGERVLVLGTGMIGLAFVAALRALGIELRITVLSRHRFQAERALALGADDAVGHDGVEAYAALAAALGTTVQGRREPNRYLVDGFDVVYDCVGSARSLHDAIRWCRPRGVVVLEGIHLYPGVLDRTPLWRREIEVVGATGQGADDWEGQRRDTFDRVIDWVRERRLRLAGLLTHRYPPSDYRRAIRTAIAKRASGAIRVALDFRDSRGGAR
jgi:threonine dehydrogenase-like Zn-dependent dehydrogenase